MSQYKIPENWDSMPTKEVLLGGTKKRIKHDLKTNTIYLLNEQGGWTGEKAKLPNQTTNDSKTEDQKENKAEQHNEECGEAETPPMPKPQKRPKGKKSKLTPFLIIVIVVLVGILVMQNSNSNPLNKTYKIMIAMENIQPGDKVEGKLSSAVISAEEYQKYAAAGGLYYSSDYSNIKHYVATTFIPQDGYISYANIAETFQVTNPWTLSGNTATITLPIDPETTLLENLLWGNEVTLTITASKEVSSEDKPDAYRPSAPDVEGSTTLQTIQIDSYTLSEVTIVDVLNSKKISLYSTYASMAAIPELYRADCLTGRYEDEKQIYSDLPAYIKVKVSAETAEWWKVLSRRKSDLTVTVKVKGAGCDTSLQNETHLALKKIVPYVQKAWDAVSEE